MVLRSVSASIPRNSIHIRQFCTSWFTVCPMPWLASMQEVESMVQMYWWMACGSYFIKKPITKQSFPDLVLVTLLCPRFLPDLKHTVGYCSCIEFTKTLLLNIVQGFVNLSNSPVASFCAQITRHKTLVHQSAILRAGMIKDLSN